MEMAMDNLEDFKGDVYCGVLDLYCFVHEDMSLDGPFTAIWPKNVEKVLPGPLFGRSGPAYIGAQRKT